jgi:hypothetical protein
MAVQCPAVFAVQLPTGVPLKVTFTCSPFAYPVATASIADPGGPEVGLTLSDGVVVKDAVAESPLGEPVAVTEYVPAGSPVGTVEPAMQLPVESAVHDPTTVADAPKVTVTTSPDAKPLALALNVDPPSPDPGETVRAGVTLKLADAVPVVPVAVTV